MSEPTRDVGQHRTESSAGVLDLDALEARAKAATPGPWTADCCSAANMVYDRSDSIGVDATREDAEFIAAANPATVLALIERVKTAEGERDDLEDRLSDFLCTVTGGRMSKTGYSASLMIQETDEYYERNQAEIVAERDAALARIAKAFAWLRSEPPIRPDDPRTLLAEVYDALTEGDEG